MLYGKILRDLKKMPETSAYRKYTEDIVSTRLGHVESVSDAERLSDWLVDVYPSQETNIASLERKINCGQIEEVIIQVSFVLRSARFILSVLLKAENELMCARRMALNSVWEPLIDKPPANQWKWPIA